MRKILGLLALLISSYAIQACDVCGCATSIGGIGYLPSSAFHFVGLGYSYRSFNNEHPKLFESDPDVFSANLMQTIELSGRWQATKKIQILGFVPYRINQIDEEGFSDISKINGFGDLSLLVNYNLVDKPNFKGFIGGGVKMPTGKSNMQTNNEVIPNMQLGTASWDGIFMSNFTYLRNKVGLNNETIVRLNTNSKWDYKFGNQYSTLFNVFYRKRVGNLLLLPQIGLKFDHQAKSIESVKYQQVDYFSGMKMLRAPVGIDVYRKNIGLRLKYEIPLCYEIAEGLATPIGNGQVQLVYIVSKAEK